MKTTPPMPATTSAKEPIKVVGDVLQAELELAAGQVMIGDEKWDIPAAQGLYVALRYVTPGRILGTSNYFDPATNQEIQEVSMQHAISVDVMSYDDSARVRKEEVVMALGSQAAELAMVENRIKIARQPSALVDVSDVEPSGRLKRYTTTVMVNALHRKVKAGAFIDKYPNGTPFTTPAPSPLITTPEVTQS
ncbi:MAG: hypothetical protein NTY77_05635 [Elusimicrobia bacterium]|nr:hypothetical protein [Elusimicrobiota bacterium]